jgi:hypothetical protein
VNVASSWMSHGVQVEDVLVDTMDCVGYYYPYFAIFYVLGHRGILVFLSFTSAYK